MSDSPALNDPFHGVFKPDSFFLQPFRGWGVTCARSGAVQRKFEVIGAGRLEVRARAAVVEQAITYADGGTDRLEWEIVSDDDGHYVGVEKAKGLRAEGRLSDAGFRWTFKMPLPKGGGKATVSVGYTLIAPDVALARADVRRFGLLIGYTLTFYQHV